MTTVSVQDVADRLPEILARAADGHEFVVTDGGKPLARIVPPDARDVRQVVRDMLAFRDARKRTLGGLTVRELRDAGRRY